MLPLIITCLVLLIILMLMAVAILLRLRQQSGGLTAGELDERLSRSESRQNEQIDRLRTSFDSRLLESTQSSAESQRKLASELIPRVEQIREETKTAIAERFSGALQGLTTALGESRHAQDERLEKVERALVSFQEMLNKTMAEGREAQVAAAQRLQAHVQERLETVRRDNSEQLEKIRATVDEKLQATLEARLGESFKRVSDLLQNVHEGLGEMKTLATGVGDLKRCLTNVRTRGTFGEVQLGALLEQVMAPSQYECNIATVPGSNERVEYAIKLPGRDDEGSIVYLPIDAKFPQEDYLRLQQAYEDADPVAVDAARKALRLRICAEAEKISAKYLCPPHTTDFALLFLPTEGLYCELLRVPGVCEDLQSRWRVTPVGPTTLLAMLNSLQMGFRTLAIEKRSSEVWKVLGAVKTEFAKFGESLEAVSSKLEQAKNNIDKVGVRSRAMERKLREVEALPEEEAVALLED